MEGCDEVLFRKENDLVLEWGQGIGPNLDGFLWLTGGAASSRHPGYMKKKIHECSKGLGKILIYLRVRLFLSEGKNKKTRHFLTVTFLYFIFKNSP